MKKIIILFAFVILGSITLLAQAPPHPPTTANNGGTNGVVGGNAPVGSGLAIMLVMSALYAGKKSFYRKQKSIE